MQEVVFFFEFDITRIARVCEVIEFHLVESVFKNSFHLLLFSSQALNGAHSLLELVECLLELKLSLLEFRFKLVYVGLLSFLFSSERFQLRMQLVIFTLNRFIPFSFGCHLVHQSVQFLVLVQNGLVFLALLSQVSLCLMLIYSLAP